MSRLQLLWLHLSVGLTAATGIVFAVMKYVLDSSDEFAVVNHPLQPHMLAAHVVIAPIALFILGWTFSNHMLPKYRFSDESRKSGISSMLLLVPMTLSGYFLQIVTSEALREAMAIAHWVSSGLFVIGYVTHLIVGRMQTGATAS
jgi:uncharacterized membrane protein YidH (DUF202 family)